MEDSSEMEGSPPTYSSSEGGFGFKAMQRAQKASKKSGDDDYDFEIDGGEGSDEEIDLGGYQPRAGKPSAVDARRQSQTRRKSTDQRMEEILRESREAARLGAAGADAGKAYDKADEIDEDPQNGVGKDSWKSSWDNLMKGLNSPTSDAASPPQGVGKTRTINSATKETDESYNSDSMEISASDFQVGADAAKRAKEKTLARQRRKALEEAPHLAKERQAGVPAAKIAASPDVKHRQAGRDAPPSFQISTALSSIQRSGDSLQISEDGGDTGYLGHGGVASSRADGDLYQMLGGRDSGVGATSMGTGRYRQNVNSSDSPTRRADVSDFSSSADGPPVQGGAAAGNGDDSIGSDESGDSGDSDLAQSAEFVDRPSRERRKGFSGASGAVDGSLSSDEYNSDKEKERQRKRESELALSAEEREERDRLRKMEEIRNRWLNPGAKPGAVATAATGGSALDYLEESSNKRDEDEVAPPKADITASSAGSGSDLPDTEADRRLASEEAMLLEQMMDANPSAMEPPVNVNSGDQSLSNLITVVGSASMVTSVPPPPPPAMTASMDNMVMTQAVGSLLEHAESRTSVLLYSDSDRDARDKAEDSSLVLADTLADQESVLQGLAVGAMTDGTHPQGNMKNRYGSVTDEESPERSKSVSAPAAPAPAPAPAASASASASASAPAPAPALAQKGTVPDITKTQQYIEKLDQYLNPQQPVVISHGLEVGDDRDTLRSGGADAVDALGRRSALSGSGGQPFLNKVVATEIDPATLGIQPSNRGQERPGPAEVASKAGDQHSERRHGHRLSRHRRHGQRNCP